MISGTITLKDGSTIELNDNVIIQGSVKYSMSTSTSGQFDIGTFNASRLKIGIYDEQSAGREFDAAVITLFEGEGEEQIATGIYYVDGTQTQRRGKTVRLVAYDAAVKFDIEKVVEADGNTTYYSDSKRLIEQICKKVGVDFVDFDARKDFENATYSITISDDNRAITTCRDMVMWICKMICANAIINREGKLEIRKAKYTADGEEITVNHTFTANDREDIEFSDIRTYIKYLTAYIYDSVSGAGKEGGNTEFTSSYTSSDSQARAATFSLPQNPLYKTPGSGWAKSWLKYIDSFKQREIKATVFDGAKVQLGDTCRFSGGKIDIGRRIIGVVTDIERTYNGKTVIICRAPKAVEVEDDGNEENS